MKRKLLRLLFDAEGKGQQSTAALEHLSTHADDVFHVWVVKGEKLVSETCTESRLYDFVKRYYEKYSMLPTLGQAHDRVSTSNLSAEVKAELVQCIGSLKTSEVPRLADVPLITEKIYAEVQDKLFNEQLLEAAEVQSGAERMERLYEVSQQLSTLGASSGLGVPSSVTVGEMAAERIANYQKRHGKNERTEKRVYSGLQELDHLTKGFGAGEATLFIGPANTGKTAMLLHVCRTEYEAGGNVVFVNTDMAHLAIWERIDALISGLSINEIAEGRLEDRASIFEGRYAQTKELPNYWAVISKEAARTTADLKMRLASLVRRKGPITLLAVDIFLRLEPSSRLLTRWSRGDEIIRETFGELKDIVEHHRCPLLAVGTTQKMPRDMREKAAVGDYRTFLADIGYADILTYMTQNAFGVRLPSTRRIELDDLKGQTRQRTVRAGPIRLGFDPDTMRLFNIREEKKA